MTKSISDLLAKIALLNKANDELRQENERLNDTIAAMNTDAKNHLADFGAEEARDKAEINRLEAALGNLSDENNYVYTMESTYFVDPDTRKRMTTVQYAKLKVGGK